MVETDTILVYLGSVSVPQQYSDEEDGLRNIAFHRIRFEIVWYIDHTDQYSPHGARKSYKVQLYVSWISCPRNLVGSYLSTDQLLMSQKPLDFSYVFLSVFGVLVRQSTLYSSRGVWCFGAKVCPVATSTLLSVHGGALDDL